MDFSFWNRIDDYFAWGDFGLFALCYLLFIVLCTVSLKVWSLKYNLGLIKKK